MINRASLKVCIALLAAGAFGSAAYAQDGAAAAAVPAVKAKQACGGTPAPGFASCHSWIVVDDAGRFAASATPRGYHPSDLRDAYNLTSKGSSAHTIAVVDAFHYPGAEADLKKYRKKFNLPPCTKANGCFDQVDQNGGHNFVGSNLGWNQEAALDLDMASAICPNCKIVLVEGNSNSFGNLATAVNTAANLPNVIAVSNSYGGGEGGTTSFESSYDHLGIAVTASTGDSGFAGGVQFPASSPHVIAVGGTSLVRDGSARGWTESVWSGAGSGCSSVYAKPTWQHDPSCSHRMVGDVSAVAAPSTGVSVYAPTGAGSAWLVFGGTSVSAPIIAGVYALNGGFVTYGSDPYGDTADLFDVTTGSNGSCGGTYFCTGKVGYDGPTGLGTPNGCGAL
jgi:subtilase family serine protease